MAKSTELYNKVKEEANKTTKSPSGVGEFYCLDSDFNSKFGSRKETLLDRLCNLCKIVYRYAHPVIWGITHNCP